MQTKLLTFAWVAVVAIVASGVVIAADHHEADTASTDDASANLGDVYAFHSDTRLTLIMTFDGYKLRAEQPSYDPDILYTFHIDTNADHTPDVEIHTRFGQNSAGEWGMQVMGVPGLDEPLVGPVGEVISEAGVQAYAGLRDDPFFFDLEGYDDTLETGTVAFDPARDFVLLKNTMAIAIEFDHAALGVTTIAVWATTGRKP